MLSYSKETGFVGYEVTLNFHNLLSNIHLDLEAGADKVTIVTRNEKEEEKAIRMVAKDSSLNSQLEKLSFKTIDHFFN